MYHNFLGECVSLRKPENPENAYISILCIPSISLLVEKRNLILPFILIVQVLLHKQFARIPFGSQRRTGKLSLNFSAPH